jgi:phosphocarrier protein
VKTAARFPNAKIELVKNGKAANAKSILEVLTLGVSKGTTITVKAEGEEADEALRSLVTLIERNFNE